jgi:carboxyl-terminal processing protease
MAWRNKYIFLVFTFFIVTAVSWVVEPLNANEQDYYFKLKKSWQQMQNVFEKINMHYVDEIDPYPLVKAGIDGMLEKLDPYTVFIEEDGERRLRMITTGKYGGLGMEIGIKDGLVTIISPMDNSPAIRSGVQAGDVITQIDGKKVDELNIDKVSASLRGEIGTKVDLVIERKGFEHPIELSLIRAEIIIEDVGYAGFIEPGIAYVSLNGFTDKAANEVRRAIQDLKKEGEIKKFILDLRGNPGGLLDAAVDVVNIFVPNDETVVFTKGFREGEIKFKTQRSPLLPNVPLAVLVNEGSASASEIVAGAFQDMDRAVILGEDTFGKGLVQKVYNVDKNSDAKVKITTAKYYIPSGRSIQKKDYGENNTVIVEEAKPENIPETNKYFTKNKREVQDHGGIHPDIYIKGDSLNYALIELIRKNHLFNFAVEYHQEHPKWVGDFEVSDDVFKQFKKYLEEHKFEYEAEGSQELDRLKKIAEAKSNSSELLAMLNKIEATFEAEKGEYFSKSREQIKRYLKLELAEKYFGHKGFAKYSIENDPQISNAINVLKNQTKYKKILAVN